MSNIRMRMTVRGKKSGHRLRFRRTNTSPDEHQHIRFHRRQNGPSASFLSFCARRLASGNGRGNAHPGMPLSVIATLTFACITCAVVCGVLEAACPRGLDHNFQRVLWFITEVRSHQDLRQQEEVKSERSRRPS
eukprot:scaffold46619_cov68-Phaeocystis_antarctica.AAC.2